MLFQRKSSAFAKRPVLFVVALLLAWIFYWAYKIEHLDDKFKHVDHKPVKLFTEDGCTIYRFYDGDKPRYYGKCEIPSSVVWDETSRLGVTLRMSISTD